MSFHTDGQLSNWSEGWMERFDEQFDGRGADPATLEVLWVEADDMRSRHPCRRIIDTWTSSCNRTPSIHRGLGGNVEQWRGLVSVYFPESEVERALCVLGMESNGDPEAKNPRSSASGLFQHLARYWPERSSAAGWGGASIWDAEANTAVAAWLWRQDGWRHWSPWLRGYCRS